MSFGGINGAGPQGAQIFGNQGAAAAGAVPGQAGAPANGATPYFGASAESILAAMSRGEVPANLGVSASALGPQVSLLQAISQGVPQNGTNGFGVTSGYNTAGGGTQLNGTSFGGTQPVDAKQMVTAPTATNQYSGN